MLVENYRPDVKYRLGIDYESAEADQSASRLCQHLGLRPGRPLSRAARLRPDRAGHGRADVDHRRARPRAGARRHPASPISRAGLYCAHGILVALLEREETGEGPVGADLAAAGADRHAGFPGRALADGRRGAQAGRQQSSDQHSHRRIRDRGRPHQHRRRPARSIWERFCRTIGREDLLDASRVHHRHAALEATATHSTRRSTPLCARIPALTGSSLQRGRRAVRADQQRSIRCSPTRRCSISAWRRRSHSDALGRDLTLVGQPVDA